MLELVIEEGLSLVHDPRVQEGKTAGMAKGLFVCCRGRLCAGESAGLGLPVWKTGDETVFPSLISVRSSGEGAIEMVFELDRTLVWHIAGKRTPAWFGRAASHLVKAYMKKTFLQQGLLALRSMVFSLFDVQSTMVPCTDRGHCRVTYEKSRQGVHVSIDGSALQGQGSLIVLNELDGRLFNRLRVGEVVLQEEQIPGWHAVTSDAVLESPSLGLGMSLSPGEERARCRVFCGREVARGLDWAGLALVCAEPVLGYEVRFHSCAAGS